MQNYIYPVSTNNENPSNKSYLRPLSSVHSINEAILDKVMPIHQVIRFANQAFENNNPVYVVIEEAWTEIVYQITRLGFFQFPRNSKKTNHVHNCR